MRSLAKLALIPALFLIACPIRAQNPTASDFLPAGAAQSVASSGAVPAPGLSPRQLYRISWIAVGAANAADTFSSWGQSEANPVLGNTFSGQSALIKAGLIGASFAIERLALHHNPGLYKKFAWINFTIAGGLGAVAVHNVAIR